jgi:hypothetical protein
VTGCFTSGTCTDGVCSGVPKDCSHLDAACKVGVCDTTDGECKQANQTNGTACTLADKCRLDPVCLGGECHGTLKDCSSLDGPCTTGSCDPDDGECKQEQKPVGASCPVENQCEENGQCNASGTCVGAPLRDGTPCSDNGCTEGGHCRAGLCDCSGGFDMATEAPEDMGVPDLGGDAPKDGCSAAPGAQPSTALLLVACLLASLGIALVARRRSRG